MLTDKVDLSRALAAARIGLGAATLLNTWEMHTTLTRIADSGIFMPFVAEWPPPSAAGIWLTGLLGALAGLALILGWYARPAAVLATLVSGWSFLWDQQTYSSHRFLALLLILMLCFTACDRVWALRPQRESQSTPWVALLMMTQLSVCYLFAGLSKINGLFLTGRPFDWWLWLDLPDVLVMTMAWGTILGEVFMAFALWFRRTRVLAVLLGVILHVSIVVMMKNDNVVLIAFAVTCMCLYPLFFVDRNAVASGRHENEPAVGVTDPGGAVVVPRA